MVKNQKIISENTHREQLFAARISMAGSIILFLVPAVIGIVVDSITLILDAGSSLIILLTAGLMYFSINKIHLPADENYNFGYHKLEPLTASIQGGLIIAACAISIKFALQDLVHPEDIHNYTLPAVATFFSGVLGVFITAYLKKTAARTKSQMLKAAGLHWTTDTALSFCVAAGFCFGILLQNLGYAKITPYVDPVMAIMLALFFIFPPIKDLTHNVLELLDAAPMEDIRHKINTVVDQHKPRAIAVHRLRLRKAGPKVFVDVCFIVHDHLTVAHTDQWAQDFEKDLKNHLPECDVIVYFKARRP